MAIGRRGIGILLAFLAVDAALIWIVNTPNSRTATTAPVTTTDQLIMTSVLAGAGIIAILLAIFFRFKPVPANLRR